ncbi:hypothetical protein [Alkalilimnicola ehrlichii]|uniref:hypothetical protein n=1 Tax=Alkalilimnicola ehrlichii TaxID=351052 RepID=UPI003BA24A20
MSEPFSFHAEWEAVDGSRGDEIRATWARFSLRVNGHPVTRVLDSRSACYRDHILVPLYPVTEWIVRNWWSLLHEPEVTGDKNYPQRHDLRFGREGYALPALNITPQGSQVTLQWRPEEYGAITFPSSGSATIPMDAFRETLTDWIEQVIARLEACQIHNTLLQQEWAAIQKAPAEERAFCIAAGIGDSPLPSNQALAEALGMSSLPLITIDRQPGTHWLDALTERSGEHQGGVALAARQEIPTRFAFCRGLMELLAGEGPVTSLVTAARTERQKRNRAFAAEFLAPAQAGLGTGDRK